MYVSDKYKFNLGDWILIAVHFLKHIDFYKNSNVSYNETEDSCEIIPSDKYGSLLYFVGVSAVGSYGIYFGIGGFLHVNYQQQQKSFSSELNYCFNQF